MERRPSVILRGAVSGALVAALIVHILVHIATGGKSWRSFISQTPITPAWWADAALQLIAFGLQTLAVVYVWLPTGYSIDQKKTVLVETVGLSWILHSVSLIAADVMHLALGSGPLALITASLLGSLAGFGALFACLHRIHPLMVRIRRAEESMRNAPNASVGLVRRGTRWLTAYTLFRLPTSVSAGLCAVRLISDASALALSAFSANFNALINPSLGLLLGVMVLAILLLNTLDEVGFALTVLTWLLGLIVATHTLLIVKGFSIALTMALAMRAAFKYVPDDDDVAVAKQVVGAKRA